MPGTKAKSQPKTLSSLLKPEVIYVASSLYGLQLDGKLRVDDLKEQLRTKMAEDFLCSNVACADAPCNTGIHVFTPSQYLADAGGNDMEALLQTSQADVGVTTPLTSPHRAPLPRADGLEQQRRLAREALQKAGLDGINLSELFPQQQQQDVPDVQGAGAVLGDGGGIPTGTRPRTNVFRNLFNMGRSASTPRQGTPGSTPGPVRHPHTLPPVLHPRHPPTQQRPAFYVPPPAPSTQQHQTAPTQSVEGGGASSNVVDTLLELVKAQKEQAERQQQSTEALAGRVVDLLERQNEEPARSATETSSKGKMALVPPINEAALALTGITIGPRWAMQGDMSNVDMSHVRKHMKSGARGQIQQDARTSELWPNQYLSAASYGKDGEAIDHEDLTFNMWVTGILTKTFSETDPARSHTPEHRQLRMWLKISRLAESYPWEEVRKISSALFYGLERGALSWKEWEPMEAWWTLQIDTLRDRILTQRLAKRPAPAAAAGAGGPPPAKALKRDKAINGIPPEVLKAKNICIKWNVGSCTVKESSHDSHDKSQKLRHICGGCWHLNQQEDESHSMKQCRLKGKDGVFH